MDEVLEIGELLFCPLTVSAQFCICHEERKFGATEKRVTYITYSNDIATLTARLPVGKSMRPAAGCSPRPSHQVVFHRSLYVQRVNGKTMTANEFLLSNPDIDARPLAVPESRHPIRAEWCHQPATEYLGETNVGLGLANTVASTCFFQRGLVGRGRSGGIKLF